MTIPRLGLGFLVLLLWTAGCGSSDGSGGDSASKGGNSGSGGSTSGGSGTGGLPTVPGNPDTSVDTALPAVPAMVDVKASATGDSVSITFDPIDGAMDYRVYELPSDDAISTSGGITTVQNALYRCAGNRQTRKTTVDGAEKIPGGAIVTKVDNQDVRGYERSLDEATLGYVYQAPGDGRVPVYVLGDDGARAENDCFFMRWNETRVKRYVTSETERDELIAQGFRDDGIGFYVPAAESADTLQVYAASEGERGSDSRQSDFYFVDGPEAQVRQGGEPAFIALRAMADGTVPLMRVFYNSDCSIHHDELVAGRPRFERARRQGADLPIYQLHYSGITGPTTLVVEALDQGCPTPADGIVGPVSKTMHTNEFDSQLPRWLTIDELRAASPSGEVFINGQFAASNRPRAIARSFIRIQPGPNPDLDWFLGFGPNDTLGTLTDMNCGEPPPGTCFQQFRQTSEVGDFIFMFIEPDRYGMAPMLGELWVNYADLGSDVNGKFRFTPTPKARVAADSYLYATMEVNGFTTSRRYPQILITNTDAPVQWTMKDGLAMVLQLFGEWPYEYQLELCDHQMWDVNNQCPKFDLRHRFEGDTTAGFLPNAEVAEETGVDKSTRFEIYVSTTRAYLLLDGKPYACAALPAGRVPTGDVTVTFGDVLYHSGVDLVEDYPYVANNLHNETSRHFDNLGFTSGSAAPAWDESLLPCSTHLQ